MRWTLRTEACLGGLGVKMSSDSDKALMLPVVLGQLKVGLNTKYVSFEYGIGGPIFAQSAGVRARLQPGGDWGGQWLYLGGSYIVILGGTNVAQFATLDLGYETIFDGGFSLLVGVGPFAVVNWFKDDETSGVGFRARVGVGYSF